MPSSHSSRQDTSIHKNLSKSNLISVPLKLVPSRICAKYEKVYEDGPKSKRVVYVKKKNPNYNNSDNKSISPSINEFFQECKNIVVMEEELRMEGGSDSPRFVNVMSSTHCTNRGKKRSHQHEPCIQPSVLQVELSETAIKPHLQRHIKCLYTKEGGKRPRRQTRGTQTMFRESSAQTIPYLPGVANDKEILKTLELFKLPKILKGDGPPGLYEVEILERARRRWSFEKALKAKFDSQMKTARTVIDRKKHLAQHKTILEAFEWEHWLQREENIQSCQMMRFDLVLRIFEKRERDMHEASNARIQKCCMQIAAKRDAALKKNEIEYGRQLRRLKIKHEQRPRNWRKEKISDQLGDPSSEYYAPQMRYGVNPNRRHFQLSRKAFEMRMEDLEKRAVNMKNLECPFAKLKEWSKPKELLCEVEQNFCSDANLQKLYESLKGLREQSKKQKIVPKCLVEKVKAKKDEIPEEVVIDDDYIIEELDMGDEENSGGVETNEEEIQVGPRFSQNSLIEMISQRNYQTFSVSQLLNERTCEELEGMLAEYEGTTIGWLMRFLSEEMSRLQEQRKLHFVTMLAQKERWRREAAEAGLRQKENEMRKIYESVFDETDEANVEVCEQYLDNIFGIDTREQADFEATINVTELAKIIDTDLQRWLTSFNVIQHPLNYNELRCLLRDLVFPDNMAECLIQRYETRLVIDYIIDDVLFPHINETLDKRAVSNAIANDLVDRLFDNDLYIFSPDCGSECDCGEVCECRPADFEANAIIRKLMRYSVPGRRWRTSTERIADVNVDDLVADVCGAIDPTKGCPYPQDESARRTTVQTIPSVLDLLGSNVDEIFLPQNPITETTTENSRMDDVTIIEYRKGRKKDRESVTKSLIATDMRYRTDTGQSSGSQLLDITEILPPDNESSSLRHSYLKKVTSTLDITAESFTMGGIEGTLTYTSTTSTSEKLEHSERLLHSSTVRTKKSAHKVDSLPKKIIDDIVKTIVPAGAGDETDKGDESNIDADRSEEDSDTGIFATKRKQYTKIRSRSMSYEDMTFSEGLDVERTQMIDENGQTYMEDEHSEVIVEAKPSEYEMVMYECELDRILFDDPDECKCQMEIDYRNHIKELYETGKIKLIMKQTTLLKHRSTAEVSTDKEIDVGHMTFEYETDEDMTRKTDLSSVQEERRDWEQKELEASENIEDTTEIQKEGEEAEADAAQPVAETEEAENVEITAEAIAEVEAQPVAETEAQPVAEAEVEAQPVAEAEVQPVAEAEVEAQPVAEAEVEAQPVAEAEVEAQPVAEAEVEAQPVAEPEPETQPEPQPQSEIQTEPDTEPQVELQPEGNDVRIEV